MVTMTNKSRGKGNEEEGKTSKKGMKRQCLSVGESANGWVWMRWMWWMGVDVGGMGVYDFHIHDDGWIFNKLFDRAIRSLKGVVN
jgi:hypothetical protein